jgi:hypothetical protein
MKKLLVTESQLKNIKNYLIETTLRSYVFDWDDNILRMPTKIFVKSNKGDVVGMSTEDFATYRSKVGKEPFNYEGYVITNFDDDPFRDFKDYKSFIRDTEKAIHNQSFAPSYKKFIEALVYANPFAINTARGHNPKALKEGVKVFINMVLEPKEKEMMVNNIKKELPANITKSLNSEQLIDLYLDERGEYYPVSSEEFGQRFGLETSGGASNPEHAKQVAIEHFVKKLLDGVKTYVVKGKYKKISLGFSDDDIRNVNGVKEFVEEQLGKLYPEVHFVIYDTSEGGKKKLVVKKD